MKKIVYFYLISAIVLLIVLYRIWPLPFQTFSKAVLLPSANAFAQAGKKVYSPVNLILNLNSLNETNKRLEEENLKLSAELSKLKSDSYDAKQLLGEITKSKAAGNILIAKVISRTPGGFNQKIIINKGERDGVVKGQTVLSSGYFIGLVSQVDKSQSEVELIFSHSLRVPVKMEKNSDGGLLQGGLEGLVVTDIPINSKIESSDNIITSGLGGQIPTGLLVGQIGLHLGVEGELFQKVRVTSPINPSAIEFVSVLQNEL